MGTVIGKRNRKWSCQDKAAYAFNRLWLLVVFGIIRNRHIDVYRGMDSYRVSRKRECYLLLTPGVYGINPFIGYGACGVICLVQNLGRYLKPALEQGIGICLFRFQPFRKEASAFAYDYLTVDFQGIALTDRDGRLLYAAALIVRVSGVRHCDGRAPVGLMVLQHKLHQAFYMLMLE